MIRYLISLNDNGFKLIRIYNHFFLRNQSIALLQSNVRLPVSSTKVSANDDELSSAKLRTEVSLMQK